MRRSAVDEVADLLRGRIHRGELSSGDGLPAEREFASELGVARITLRGALARLQEEGYLEARRGVAGGSFVTELTRPYQQWLERMQDDRQDLEDLIEYRLAVERQTARLAAERATQEDLHQMSVAIDMLDDDDGAEAFRRADSAFHSALAVASRSLRLRAASDEARGELFAPTDQLIYDIRGESTRVEHQRILDAVEAGDPIAAAEAVEQHLTTTRDALRQLLDSDYSNPDRLLMSALPPGKAADAARKSP